MFHSVDPLQVSGNFAQRYGRQWALITAGDAAHCNSMTAAWGGLGFLWNEPVATIYIRPQRYTYSLIEKADYFTVSFLPEQYRAAMGYMGKYSGRDGDKYAATGLTVAYAGCGAPYVAQSELVLVCKKLFRHEITAEDFIDRTIVDGCYPERDFHVEYIGKIIEAYEDSDA